MKAEDRLQIAVMSYIRLQYPNALAIHVGNERKTSPMAGALLKRKGVMAGVSDILIFTPNKHHHGLCIELKIKPNKPTDSQLEFMRRMSIECKWGSAVCYTLEQAIAVINLYFNNILIN